MVAIIVFANKVLCLVRYHRLSACRPVWLRLRIRSTSAVVAEHSQGQVLDSSPGKIFLDFTMVPKGYAPRRNHASDFECWSFPRWAMDSRMLSCDAGQRPWAQPLVSPVITRINQDTLQCSQCVRWFCPTGGWWKCSEHMSGGLAGSDDQSGRLLLSSSPGFIRKQPHPTWKSILSAWDSTALFMLLPWHLPNQLSRTPRT